MSLLENIYNASPAFIQNIMCTVKGFTICKRRYNKDFHKILSNFENGNYIQSKELLNFLSDVHKLKPYNKYWDEKLFEECKSDSNKVYELIKKFPIIDKNDVKNNINDFINKDYKLPQFEMRTGGSTGGALIFPYSHEMEHKQWAIWWRIRKKLGLNLSTWCGWFGGRQVISPKNQSSPYWRINICAKQVMFSSGHITEDTIRLYHDKIFKSKLRWIHGYPTHITRFASLVDRLNLPPITTVDIITTGSENLLDFQKNYIKKAFPNAIIRQIYGQSEGVANMYQDVDGNWKEDNDFCYIEYIPFSDDNPNICRIIGTGFSNKAFPLIRYDTGDIATIKTTTDGRPNVISINGRSTTEIIQPNGNKFSEATLGIFFHDFMNIVEAQFHQHTLNDVDLFIVKGKLYTDDDEKMILSAIKKWFDESMKISIKYVEKIPRTKSGKLRTIVSDIS